MLLHLTKGVEMRSQYLFALPFFAMAAMATPAAAADEDFEFWLSPSVEFDLDDDTAIEVETAQRFRDAGNGRVDTYFARLWLKQDVGNGITLAGGLERRINDGGRNEVRVMQQASLSSGIFRARLRLEERFQQDRDGRMGLRLRPRAGVSFPLGDDGRWSAGTSAELFWTLRSNSPGGDTGITGLRTQVGVDYEVSDNLELGLTFLRQQDFEAGAPDEIAYAPVIGIEFSF